MKAVMELSVAFWYRALQVTQTVKELFILCLNNKKGRGKDVSAGEKRREASQDRSDPEVLQPCDKEDLPSQTLQQSLRDEGSAGHPLPILILAQSRDSAMAH